MFVSAGQLERNYTASLFLLTINLHRINKYSSCYPLMPLFKPFEMLLRCPKNVLAHTPWGSVNTEASTGRGC